MRERGESKHKCNFCSFYSIVQYIAEDHQKSCEFNPKNRTCHTCNGKMWNAKQQKFDCFYTGKNITERLYTNCRDWVEDN